MDYNYHTHTVYCSHATGTMEEYVQNAIRGGIRYMGFAEHAPLPYPDGHETWFRLAMADIDGYMDEVKRLKEKYRDQIELHAGFEMEYYPEHFERMLNIAKDAGVEYLILGQHYTSPEHTGGVHVLEKDYELEHLRNYVKLILEAMETGVFTYIAHPDMYQFVGDNLRYREEVRKICIAAREKGIPLELNLLGIRDHRYYPYEPFWKVAGEEGSPVTFGFDSHAAEDAYDGESIRIAKGIVKKYGLNYIGKPILKSIGRGGNNV